MSAEHLLQWLTFWMLLVGGIYSIAVMVYFKKIDIDILNKRHKRVENNEN